MVRQGKARIAVIGTGWWSTYTHIPGLQANPDAELVAICDVNEQKLRAAAEQYRLQRTYTSVPELLHREELDGVVIGVHHAAHYEVAKAVLERGLPIMLEKPMVLHAAEAWDLVGLAQRRGVELIVGYPWHYTAIAERARQVIESGELGPIQYVTSQFASMVVEFYRGNPQAYQPVFHYPVTGPTKRTYSDVAIAGGGQGHLQVTHSGGLMFWVTGQRAQRVSGQLASFDLPVDLVDAITVRFESGALGTVGSTGNLGIGDGGQHELRVYCAEGYLLLDMVAGTLAIKRHTATAAELIGPLAVDDRYPRFATAANLVDVILGRDVNHSPGVVGARTVEFLEAAYTSAARDGAPVDVAAASSG
jgi:predicted dehydrogenase